MNEFDWSDDNLWVVNVYGAYLFTEVIEGKG